MGRKHTTSKQKIAIARSKLLIEEIDLDYNTNAGYFCNKELQFNQTIPTKDYLRYFNPYQYNANGFYIGTITNEESKKHIDDLQSLLKRKNSILEFRNATKIFNTINQDIDPMTTRILKVDQHAKMDKGRNQLCVIDCLDNELKVKAEIVGRIFRDQVLSDLGINVDHNEDIVLSILETEATKGNDKIPHQLLHADVDSNNPELGKKHMWIGILGLEDESYIRVLKHSHIKERTSNDTRRKKKRRMGTTSINAIRYEKYKYFVGHPFLVHGGFGSLPERGLRLHGYYGFPASVRLETHLVDWSLFEKVKHAVHMKENVILGAYDKGLPGGY